MDANSIIETLSLSLSGNVSTVSHNLLGCALKSILNSSTSLLITHARDANLIMITLEGSRHLKGARTPFPLPSPSTRPFSRRHPPSFAQLNQVAWNSKSNVRVPLSMNLAPNKIDSPEMWKKRKDQESARRC